MELPRLETQGRVINMSNFQALESLILISFLIFLYHLWIRTQVDSFRENLFSLRNKNFDLARESSSYSFDSILYRRIELKINSTIQFAHKANFSRGLFFSLLTKWKYPDIQVKRSIDIEINSGILKINDEILRKNIHAIMLAYKIEFIKFLILTSPILAIFAFFVFLHVAMKGITSGINDMWKNFKKTLAVETEWITSPIQQEAEYEYA